MTCHNFCGVLLVTQTDPGTVWEGPIQRWGFPGGSVVNAGGARDPWVRKIPWNRKWQLTPVFLPGESRGQRSLEGYSLVSHKESDMTERLSTIHRYKHRRGNLGRGHSGHLPSQSSVQTRTCSKISWWPSDQYSRLSLPWPGFSPWSGNWDSISHEPWPKKKKYWPAESPRLAVKEVWSKISRC